MNYIPNLLTILRILLIPIFCVLFLQERYALALWIFAAAALTDFLDGILARTLNAKTPLGAVLDPAADKFMMLSSFIVLSIAGILPIWLAVLVIAKDFYTILGTVILKYYYKKEWEIRASLLGKTYTFLQLCLLVIAFGLTFIRYQGGVGWSSWIGPLEQVLRIMIFLTGGMTPLVAFHYTKVGFRVLRGA